MGLEHILAAVRSLTDLPALLAALGGEPRWEELPAPSARVIPGRALPIGRLAIIGEAGGLRWFGVEATEPAATARRLARHFGGLGEAVGVIALCLDTRRLALAAGLEDPAVAEIRLDQPGALNLSRLRRLTGGGGPISALERAEIALTTEDVGRRFFSAFQRSLDRMAAGLTGTVRPADRQPLALLQLMRVLFLYFVQAKGWLDGRPDFLRTEVDRCLQQGRRVHRDLLRPLFFGTLNRRPCERRRTRRFGRIPFLNGGLFEPHPLERCWRGEVPNGRWREAFDEVFERFCFTVSEGTAAGAIAPDMLGRVFEGVMNPEARRASGTFFTPAGLVQGVLDDALAAFVARRLGLSTDEARARLAAGERTATAALESVTLLDPAVGSGAFLLGALERLAALRAPEEPTRARREILSRNLFGVDLHPMAVRLTELRLWLAVIADDRTAEPERVEPLPNLDCLIRQGDSLIDPMGGVSMLPLRAGATAPLLAELRRRLVPASGEAKREWARRLRRAELAATRECLDVAEARLELAVAECLGEARAPTLFGEARGLDRELAARLAEARQRLRQVRRIRRRLITEGAVPWFHYESHFADVFARGGFDLVVGNPPWVRAEQLPAQTREALARRYRWWRGSGPGFSHRPDLSLAFVERGLELLAPDGVLAFLVPAKLATAAYGAAARRALASRVTLHTVADLTESRAAPFHATVYPLALIATKHSPDPDQLVATTLGAECAARVPQARLLGGAPWVMVPAPAHAALSAISADHPRLGDCFTLQLGVKTGANRIFLERGAPVEPVLLRWALRGRDVRPFTALRRAPLIWTHDRRGTVLPRLPPRAAAYFAAHEAALRSRADYVTGPPWTLFRAAPAAAEHRVVWADIARTLRAVALSGDAQRDLIPLNTCYVIACRAAEEAQALAAWLNCTWLRAAALAVADPARGGFARFNARTLGSLPLPRTVLADRDLVRLAELGAEGTAVQEELDAVSARHLGLTPADRAALSRLVARRADGRR